MSDAWEASNKRADEREREAKAEAEVKRRKAQLARLKRFLCNGGVLLREDHGGAVGVQYHQANRSRKVFETDHVEEAMKSGVTAAGKYGGRKYSKCRWEIIEGPRPDTFVARPA